MADLSHLSKLITQMSQCVIGKKEVSRLLVCALLCRGHILIEDVPGVGKTTLALTLAQGIGLSFQRIQFTPDLMPSDITGYSILDPMKKEFVYRPGACMTNLLLADEINRASPKTQSALLEAMQEGQVTVDGKTYPLPSPFILLATENPVELQGTYPLPEAQYDRFLFKLKLGYPEKEDEIKILSMHRSAVDSIVMPQVLTGEELEMYCREVRKVTVRPELAGYIVDIASATRYHRDLLLGASPRASIALMRAAQASAYMDGRSYVTPDDIGQMIPHVLTHRLVLKKEAIIQGKTASSVLASVVSSVTMPTLPKL